MPCCLVLSQVEAHHIVERDVRAGFAAASRAVDVLSEDKVTTAFAVELGTIVQGISLFLKVVNTITGIVSDFAPPATDASDSFKEEVKTEFLTLNTKLDRLTNVVDDLGPLIEWVEAKSRFDEYTSKIDTHRRELAELANSSAEAIKAEDIIRHYDNGYDHSGTHLMGTLLGSGTQRSILDLYADHVDNHRAKMLRLMQVGLKYVLAASELETAVLKLRLQKTDEYSEAVKDSHIEDETAIWIHDLQILEARMKAIDDALVVRVDRALTSPEPIQDIQNVANVHPGLNSRDFVMTLFNTLARKYYWRKWLVAAHDRANKVGSRTLSAGQAGGVWETQGNSGNRVLVVANRPQDSTFNPVAFTRYLRSYKSSRSEEDHDRPWYCLNCRWFGGCCADSECHQKPKDHSGLVWSEIERSLGCHWDGGEHCPTGLVVKQCLDLEVRASPGSLATQSQVHRCDSGRCSMFQTLLFG